MTRLFSPTAFIVSILATINLLLGTIAVSEPQNGIAMYGEPDLKSGFMHLPYANPEAPKGGRMILGETGGFDSLNPYILKGRAPWGVRQHTVESLMGRSWDEPFTLYGLLAETIETGPNREWVAFKLRENAKFSDGAPVTVEDVLWSFEMLGTKGHPRYSHAWKKIKTAEQIGPRSIKFTFNTIDRELPLILGLRPILQKADWEGRNFEDSSLDKITGTGPYVVSEFEPSRFIRFKRNPDYWGKDLALNRGRNNLDEIRYEYFSDSEVVFEAFKAGVLSIYRENNAGKWDAQYNFPRVANGEVVKSVIPHLRPSGIWGLVMNTRRPQFSDIRVRDALIHAFNFEFINNTINGISQPRITSYFSNSVLGMSRAPAIGKTRVLLEPFINTLPEGVMEGYALPVSDGSERNRNNLRKARKLLEEANWTIQDGELKNENNESFELDILIKSGSTSHEGIVNIYIDALKRLGIHANISLIDNAQYNERTNIYDFDMTFYKRTLSLSPGNEQILYWGKEGVDVPGTRNYMGMNSPAAEAMISAMLAAEHKEDFVAAVKALDRILTAGRYVVPFWYSAESWFAHNSELKFPERLPMYGDSPGFVPEVWWSEH